MLCSMEWVLCCFRVGLMCLVWGGVRSRSSGGGVVALVRVVCRSVVRGFVAETKLFFYV